MRPLIALTVPVHSFRRQQRILPMLLIPDRQNLLPPLYHPAFSVQKMLSRVHEPLACHLKLRSFALVFFDDALNLLKVRRRKITRNRILYGARRIAILHRALAVELT